MQFLITTRTHWEEPPRSRHQVAQALAKNYSVCFLTANKIGLPKILFRKLNNNLTIITPFWFLSSKIRLRIPLINEIYQLWLFKKIETRFKDFIVINFDHTYYTLSKYFNNQVYYCSDEFIGNGNFDNLFINGYHKYCEKRVIKKSLLCIATTKTLLDKIKKYNQNSFEIKLGAPDISDINKYIHFNKRFNRMINVGFVGFVDSDCINYKLLKNISKIKGIKLIIIGPYKKSKNYAFGPNTVFLGEKKHDELYNELKKIDVGIATYSKNANSGISPNKLWLYLSLGKPTVVSNLVTIHNWIFEDKYVYKANNDIEFINFIYAAFNDDSKPLMLKRIELAKQNSWDMRINQFISILKNAIK